MTPIVTAFRKLRSTIGDTREAFAAKLGVSLRAVGNYEKDRTPPPEILYKLAKLASEADSPDLARTFSDAFQSRAGDPVLDSEDRLDSEMLRLLLDNRGAEWFETQLALLIKDARDGAPLMAPQLFNGDRTPDQASRLRYLESVLVDRKLRTAVSATKLLEEMSNERSTQTGESKERSMLELLTANPKLYERYNSERRESFMKGKPK